MGKQSFVACGVVLASLMFVAGCEKKIDASSKEAFEKSTQEIAKDMDATKKEKFEGAIGALMLKAMFSSVGEGAAAVEGGGAGGPLMDEKAAMAKIKETFHGKSADEVIDAGEKVKAENQAEMQKLIDGK
jgi:hypothetical protein